MHSAFSMHSKGTKYSIKTSEEALTLVRKCKYMLHNNTADIRNTGIKGALNRPQDQICDRTVASIGLYDNLMVFDYQATNL